MPTSINNKETKLTKSKIIEKPSLHILTLLNKILNNPLTILTELCVTIT
jgi:hypothetical protein